MQKCVCGIQPSSRQLSPPTEERDWASGVIPKQVKKSDLLQDKLALSHLMLELSPSSQQQQLHLPTLQSLVWILPKAHLAKGCFTETCGNTA